MADKKSDVVISMLAMLVLGAGLCVGSYYMLKGAWVVTSDTEEALGAGGSRRVGSVIGLLGAGGLILGAGGVSLLFLAGKYAWTTLRRGGWEGGEREG